jgi:hypothetical protein
VGVGVCRSILRVTTLECTTLRCGGGLLQHRVVRQHSGTEAIDSSKNEIG